MTLTLTPAYGKDYKSKKEIEADLLAGKDFVARSYNAPDSYINLEQLQSIGIASVDVRYKRETAVCVVKLSALKVK